MKHRVQIAWRGVIEPENVLCYLPVREMCCFPDLTLMETLHEVSSLSRVGCQTVFLFPQNKFVRATWSSPVIRKYCFPKRQDASQAAELHKVAGVGLRGWRVAAPALRKAPFLVSVNPLCHHSPSASQNCPACPPQHSSCLLSALLSLPVSSEIVGCTVLLELNTRNDLPEKKKKLEKET